MQMHPEDQPGRFSCEWRVHAGTTVAVLRDQAAGSEVWVAPGLGNACLRFLVRIDGTPWHVLAEPPSEPAFREETTRYGIPILYPWPNRIHAGRFTFRGREHQIPPNSPGGHANHGLVRDQRWEVSASGGDSDGAFVRALAETGGGSSGYPYRSVLAIEHRLNGTTLDVRAEATNLGDAPMPIGFGLHPWFAVPLARNGSRDDCEVKVPARHQWELANSIPTGRTVQVAGPDDLRSWRSLADGPLDQVYTDLPRRDGWFTAELRDSENLRVIEVRSDNSFREHVVYAPLDRPVVCLEPYTCTTDAFNLDARGVDAGVIVLDPGGTWRGRVVIAAEHRRP